MRKSLVWLCVLAMVGAGLKVSFALTDEEKLGLLEEKFLKGKVTEKTYLELRQKYMGKKAVEAAGAPGEKIARFDFEEGMFIPRGPAESRTSIEISDEEAYSGKYSAAFNYEFVKPAGQYENVYFFIPFEKQVSFIPKKYSFWVYGDESKNNLCFRCVDAKDEWFQADIPKITWKGWKQVAGKFLSWHSWGGNNDKVMDLPLKEGAGVLIGNGGGPGASTIYIDEFILYGE